MGRCSRFLGEGPGLSQWRRGRYKYQCGRPRMGRLLKRIPGEPGGPDPLGELAKRAEAVAIEVDDLNYELEKLVGAFDIDEGELEAAQSRVFRLQDLFRKHSVQTLEEFG